MWLVGHHQAVSQVSMAPQIPQNMERLQNMLSPGNMAIWQNMGTMQNMVALHQLLTMQGREVIMELPHHPQPLAKSQLLTHMGLTMVSRVQNMQCLIGVNMHKHRVHMGRLIHGMTLPEGIRMHMLQRLLPNKDRLVIILGACTHLYVYHLCHLLSSTVAYLLLHLVVSWYLQPVCWLRCISCVAAAAAAAATTTTTASASGTAREAGTYLFSFSRCHKNSPVVAFFSFFCSSSLMTILSGSSLVICDTGCQSVMSWMMAGSASQTAASYSGTTANIHDQSSWSRFSLRGCHQVCTVFLLNTWLIVC